MLRCVLCGARSVPAALAALLHRLTCPTHALHFPLQLTTHCPPPPPASPPLPACLYPCLLCAPVCMQYAALDFFEFYYVWHALVRRRWVRSQNTAMPWRYPKNGSRALWSHPGSCEWSAEVERCILIHGFVLCCHHYSPVRAGFRVR